jgi:hypothetical protein
VADGNYRAVTMDGPVWERADTVVFLDLPRHVVMRRLVPRTLRRVVTREDLWNGNREEWRYVLSWNAETSVIRWSWEHHGDLRDRYIRAMSDPNRAHLSFVRLCSPRQVAQFLAATAGGVARPGPSPSA